MIRKVGLAHIGNGSLWVRSPQLGKVVHKPERQLEVLLSERPGAIGLLNGLQRLLAVACMQLLCNLQRMRRVNIEKPACISEVCRRTATLQDMDSKSVPKSQISYLGQRGLLLTA